MQCYRLEVRAFTGTDGDNDQVLCRLCTIFVSMENYKEAIGWCRKAVRQGWCASELENLYALGHGVAKNEVEAFRLFEEAAEAGHYPSALRIAKMLETGSGVEKDMVDAYRWYWKVSRGEMTRSMMHAKPSPEVQAAAGREVGRLNTILKPEQIAQAKMPGRKKRAAAKAPPDARPDQ